MYWLGESANKASPKHTCAQHELSRVVRAAARAILTRFYFILGRAFVGFGVCPMGTLDSLSLGSIYVEKDSLVRIISYSILFSILQCYCTLRFTFLLLLISIQVLFLLDL